MMMVLVLAPLLLVMAVDRVQLFLLVVAMVLLLESFGSATAAASVAVINGVGAA